MDNLGPDNNYEGIGKGYGGGASKFNSGSPGAESLSSLPDLYAGGSF